MNDQQNNHQGQAVLRAMINGSLFGGFLYPLWFAMDWMMLKGDNRLIQFAAIRFIVILSAFVFVILGQSPARSGQATTKMIKFGAVSHQILGQGIIVLTYLMPMGPETNYYSGLVLVFIGLTVLIPWHYKYTLMQLGLWCLSYVVMMLFYYRGVSIPFVALSNLVFLISSAVCCGFCSVVISRLYTTDSTGTEVTITQAQRFQIAGTTERTETTSTTKRSGSAMRGALITAIATIIGSLITAGIKYNPNSPNETERSVLQDDEVVFVQVMSPGEQDECILVKNNSNHPIKLDGDFQVILNESHYEIAAEGTPRPLLLPQKHICIYTQSVGKDFTLKQPEPFGANALRADEITIFRYLANK